MKTPEYVATVTRIYRKYIDLAFNQAKEYVVDDTDKKDLLQVFNRGGFSSGHLLDSPNKNLVFPNKSNNMGLFLGTISNYDCNKGHITLKISEDISIGDCISIDGETGKYTISEIIKNNNTLKQAKSGEFVVLGRMKGNIKPGLKVFKLSSKDLITFAKSNYINNKETKKIELNCSLTVEAEKPMKITLHSNVLPFYEDICVQICSNIIPEHAISSPLTKEYLINQLSKLGNTPYVIKNFNIKLGKDLHVSSVSQLNNLRRTAISALQKKVLEKNIFKRIIPLDDIPNISNSCCDSPSSSNTKSLNNRKISICLENLNKDFDYSKLEGADNVYIPIKFLNNKKFENQILSLSNKFNIFVYMPTIIKPNYKNLLLNSLENMVLNFNIKGFVISNIAGFNFFKKYLNGNYSFVANYTMNIFNKYTINELQSLGITCITPSIELNKSALESLCKNSSLPIELIAYGRNILMNTSYCLLGKSNKCYPECKMKCSNSSHYYLKDRLGFNFRILPDNIQTVTSIYNSKITSIDTYDFNVSSVRINILDENINEINNIIKYVKSGRKLDGKNYTNGNLNREI